MDLSAVVTRWSPHKNACGEAFTEEANQGPASPALRGELVRFVDGAYTKWHYHSGEQMLLATAGEGFVECQDRPVVTIREGARAYIPPGVWHRHGAVPKSTLVHLAVTYGFTTWADDHPCRQPSSPTSQLGLSVQREIAYLNERILHAEESGQVADLGPLLAKAFYIVRSTGEKADREEFLAAVSANANRGRTVSDVRVDLRGECAAFSCIVATTKTADGSPDAAHFWNTRLFICEDGQWRCAQWQVTRIPETRG
jgi:quercetin dioxygenase-like cupin family protein